jgi:DNA-binding transcriptional LysR family regulator
MLSKENDAEQSDERRRASMHREGESRVMARRRERNDAVESFEPPFEARKFTMVAAWHARRLEEPAVRWFRDLVVEVAATL